MPDICHFDGCDNISSYDNCANCSEPTCHQHGKEVGGHFIGYHCIDEEGEEG